MVVLLVAAALAAGPAAIAQSSSLPAEPALFVVSDADTTIYIFGTFHALDRKSQWFGEKIRGAFEQSDELVLETIVPENRPGVSEAPARPQPISITPSASFLTTTQMAISAGRAQGMQVGDGADMILRHAAEAEGKPVEGLETLQLQVNMFNRMPPAPTPAALRARGFPNPAKAAQLDGLSKAMVEMQAAWKCGDQRVFVDLLRQLKAASPDTYRMMFTDRNARWADWVRARLQTPGTVFLAVGAGHLAGPDSLLVRLAERGIPSRRVNEP